MVHVLYSCHCAANVREKAQVATKVQLLACVTTSGCRYLSAAWKAHLQDVDLLHALQIVWCKQISAPFCHVHCTDNAHPQAHCRRPLWNLHSRVLPSAPGHMMQHKQGHGTRASKTPDSTQNNWLMRGEMKVRTDQAFGMLPHRQGPCLTVQACCRGPPVPHSPHSRSDLAPR